MNEYRIKAEHSAGFLLDDLVELRHQGDKGIPHMVLDDMIDRVRKIKTTLRVNNGIDKEESK